jgi:hypothetical protein
MRVRSGTIIRGALDRARRLPASLGRTGRWPLVLGALLLTTSTATVLATANTPPKIVGASVSPQVLNEGQTAVLTVNFADVDRTDSHTLRVKWHDTNGVPPITEVYQLPPQQTSIHLPHTFRDSVAGPSGSKIQVTLYDRQTSPGSPNDNTEGAGQDAIFVPIAVKNVAPSFNTPITVTSSRVSATQVLVKVDGTIVDGAADTHKMTASEGSRSGGTKQTTPASSCTVQSLRFHCELTYGAQDIGTTQQVSLHVKDDEGAQAATTVTAKVQEASES